MRKISIDNGINFVTPKEALEEFGLDVIAYYMNDEDRERTHREIAPCSEQEFLTHYLKIAREDLIIG